MAQRTCPRPLAGAVFFMAAMTADSASSAELVPFRHDVEVGASFGDSRSDIGTDGAGTWVAIWTTDILTSREVQFVRSVDGARTWSAATALNSGAGSYTPGDVTLATNRSGVWIAMWSDDAEPRQVRYAISTDNGATWGTEQILTEGFRPSLVRSNTGTWLVAWTRKVDGLVHELTISRSTDDGAVWSMPHVIDTVVPLEAVDVATDDAGKWVLAADGGTLVLETHSADDGSSWSTVTQRSPALARSPSVATDASGRWFILYQQHNPNFFDVMLLESTDNGVTWSEPRSLDPNAAGTTSFQAAVEHPQILYSDGRWVATWTASGKPYQVQGTDVLYSTSVDGGQSWRLPAAVNANAAGNDGALEHSRGLATDGNGRWAAMLSTAFGKKRIAVSARDCPELPAAGCRSAESSSLTIRNLPSYKDSLRWKWKRGGATESSEFIASPMDDELVFCLYRTQMATADLIHEKEIPNGSECGAPDCWTQDGTDSIYEDRPQLRSSTRLLELKAGEEGRAAARFSGSSLALDPPDLPIAPGVVHAQLVNLTNGNCWESVFGAARRNDDTGYKAVSP